MALVSMNDGIVGSINKLEQVSPNAAASLVELGLYEALCDYTDAHRGEISKVLYDGARAEVAKARTVAKRMGNEALIDTLEEVAKELVGYDLTLFNQKVNRDQGGRFARQSSGGSSDDDSKGSGGNTKGKKQPKTGGGSVMQSINRAERSGLVNGDTQVRVTTGTGADEETSTVSVSALQDRMHSDRDFRNSISDIQVSRSRSSAPKGNDAASLFDLASTATDPSRANRLANAAAPKGNISAQDFRNAGEKFTRASDGNDRRSYRQMEMLGSTLRNTADPGSDLHMAGAVANLVGRLGPEAEAVIGPGVRRTAYRYRGTERRPDANLRAASGMVSNELESLSSESGGDFDRTRMGAANRYNVTRGQGRPGQERTTSDSEIGGVINAAMSDHVPDINEESSDELPNSRFSTTRSMDSVALQARGDAVTANLIGALKGSRSVLPTAEQVKISQSSGSQPPSHGVILDAEGNLITQAHGFNGDHYLPFDLKNLKALRGGQYVRTRASGGPTSEDIYTGLMSGARQFQVASSGGVFSVQFDPDLRGGRRFSDKSRNMVKRYEEILETIADRDNTNGLMAQDFSPQEKAEHRKKARELSSTPQEFKEKLREVSAKARFELMTDDEFDTLEETVSNKLQTELRSGSLSRQQLAQRKRDLEIETLESMRNEGGPRQMTLNSEGYKAALDTLQAEFPYAIREVKHETLRDWAARRELRAQDGLAGAGAAIRSDSGYKSRSDVDAQLRSGYKSRSQREEPVSVGAGATSSNDVAARTSVPSGQQTGFQGQQSTSSTASNGAKVDSTKVAEQVVRRQGNSMTDLRHAIGGTEFDLGAAKDTLQSGDEGAKESLKRSDIATYAVARAELSGLGMQEIARIVMESPYEQGERLRAELVHQALTPYFDQNESTAESKRNQVDDEFKELLSWKAAVEPTRNASITDRPAMMDMRPPKAEGIPSTSLSTEEFARARSNLEFGDQSLERAVADLQVGSGSLYDRVNELWDDEEMDDNEKATLNTAWALLAAEDANKKLNSLKGSGTPKAQGGLAKSLRAGRAPWTLASTPPDDDLREFLSDVAKRVEQLQSG